MIKRIIKQRYIGIKKRKFDYDECRQLGLYQHEVYLSVQINTYIFGFLVWSFTIPDKSWHELYKILDDVNKVEWYD